MYLASTGSVSLQLRSAATFTPIATPTPTPTGSPTPTPTPTGSPTRAATATPLAGPALSVRPSSIPQGGAVSAAWGGVPTPTADDWLGLYTEGAVGHQNPLATVVVGAGLGQVAFPVSATLTPGSYELRLFRGSGTGSHQATSNVFAVTSLSASPTPTPGVSLTARPERVPAGGTLSATWQGLVGPSSSDWLGLYVPGSAHSANLTTPVTLTGQASGQVSVAVPATLAPGTYELRLFKGAGTSNYQATSNLVTVTTPGTSYLPGGHLDGLAAVPEPPQAPPGGGPEPLASAAPRPLLGRLALDARLRAGGESAAPDKHAVFISAEDDEPYWTPKYNYVPGLASIDAPYSPWLAEKALVAEPGVTALAGQVLRVDGEPLADVTLAIGDMAARTDAVGRFLLAGVPDGRHELLIDGRSANTPNRTYGVFVVGVDLVAGETTALEYTVWLPRLDTAHHVAITSPLSEDLVLTTPRIPGLDVHIPAGSVIRDHEGNPVTEIGITPVLQDRPPFPIPPGRPMPLYFTIQPGGATIEPYGARIVYPNVMNEAPGARIDFSHYEPLR
jgi:hypothetical protein